MPNHKHNLDRQILLTKEDGSHYHLFKMPDGSVISTLNDGSHRHFLEDSVAKQADPKLSGHFHGVVLKEYTVVTELGGEHTHVADEEMTEEDGAHQHELVLQDGTVLVSMTQEEAESYYEEQGKETLAKAEEFEEDEKRIAYGVVLDPYVIDAHDDLIPPSEVEKAAHAYMEKRQVIGIQHNEVDEEAQLLESFLVHYPSHEDYTKAMNDEDHSIYSMPFGDQEVHSGSWVIGVRFSKERWELIKSGEVTGFSIGGFGMKKEANVVDRPTVNILKLQNEEEL